MSKYLRHSYLFDESCGEIGEPSELFDINNRPLFVGDVVETMYENGEVFDTNFVIHPSDYGLGDFIGVDGLHKATRHMKDGIADNGYKIRKIKNFDEVEIGTEYCGIVLNA